jgi:transposase
VAAIAAAHPKAERVETWFLDEARVGQKGRMVRRWFARGYRPRMVKDVRYRSAYIFGAVCPERDVGAALVLPVVSAAGMTLLLEELSLQVPANTHAAVLIDRAGWHIADEVRVPSNITLIYLPPYSPELNAIERVWLYLRDRYLSGRLFASGREIVDACCDAWNRLVAEPGRLRSLTNFAWARQVRT